MSVCVCVQLYDSAVRTLTQPPKPQPKPKKSGGGGGGGLFDEGEEEDDIFSFSTSAIKRARSASPTLSTLFLGLCILTFEL